jgi:hypothetical protein
MRKDDEIAKKLSLFFFLIFFISNKAYKDLSCKSNRSCNKLTTIYNSKIFFQSLQLFLNKNNLNKKKREDTLKLLIISFI